MKLIALGDTHGRTLWKEIVEKNQDADKIVFIGDYFDTHDNVSVDQQIENFKDIIEFKKNNMEKVVLLLGNHDFHYLNGAQEKYSGFQAFRYKDINKVLEPEVADGLIQMCFVYDKYVFTHAGVTKTWALTNKIRTNHLEEDINNKFKTDIAAFRFTYGQNYSQTGNDVTQPPIWVRVPSLYADSIDSVTYVVGHTTVEKMAFTDKIIGIDTLGTTGEYLIIENKVPFSSK
jgi:hypothetical protein